MPRIRPVHRLDGRRGRTPWQHHRVTTTSAAAAPAPALANSPFLLACRGERGSHTPVWFMRQAGRALPEYRKLRAGTSMLDSCMTPDLVTEITLQPVRRLGVDAAIFFSDIVVPLKAIGVDLEIAPGVGPVVARPFGNADDLQRLPLMEPSEDIPYITEAVQQLVRELDVPLIGFAGAPFTLASYLLEGGPSKAHAKTKAFMYAEPAAWAQLLDRLADITLAFLRTQILAGASAVQLFDSWVGALSPADYRTFVMPASAKIFAGLADLGVPRIHFGVGTGELLAQMSEVGADVVGVDWRVPLDEAARRVPGKPLQGNLDPVILFAPAAVVDERVGLVLDAARNLRGHIFNLGHGVMPETDPDMLKRVVDVVHEKTAR
jgi:uroporphyrinogen decarboxylase